jgi:hypothetical protein
MNVEGRSGKDRRFGYFVRLETRPKHVVRRAILGGEGKTLSAFLCTGGAHSAHKVYNS